MKNILILKDKDLIGGPSIWLKYLIRGFSDKEQEIHIKRPALPTLSKIRKYNLIHIYEFSIYSLLITKIALFYKIPVLTTLHGNFLSSSKYQNPIKRILIVSTVKSCLKNATLITTPSTYLKNVLHKKNIADYEKIHYIPNPLDLKFIKNIKPPSKQNYLNITQITDFKYLQKARAIVDTIRAVRAVKNPAIRLTIIGGRGYFKHFKDKYSSHNILFKGLLSHRATLRNIKSADIIVHSTYLDNAPISLLEAMACGKPIICYDIGGIKELVEDCAIVCSPKDFIKEFRSLSKNNNKQRKLSKKAILRSELFSNKIISKKFESLYNSLIDG